MDIGLDFWAGTPLQFTTKNLAIKQLELVSLHNVSILLAFESNLHRVLQIIGTANMHPSCFVQKTSFLSSLADFVWLACPNLTCIKIVLQCWVVELMICGN